MLRLIIDGVDRSHEVDGLTDLSERLYWSVDLAAFITELNGNLVAFGETYNYLRSAYRDSVCGSIEVTIVSPCDTYSGLIYINDIQWNLSKRLAEIQIVTSPIIQLIDNNKSIDVTLGAGLSKNLVDISAYTLRRNCILDNPTGGSDTTDRLGWRIYDAFAYLIAFMSDGELSFTSDFFNYLSNVYEPQKFAVLMRGAEVRLGPLYDTDFPRPDPVLSFSDLYNDMKALFNVGMVAEGNTIRIEPRTYWLDGGTVQYIDAIEELKSNLDRSQFYSAVNLGSVKYDSDNLYLGKVAFYGHRPEQYHLTGQCNIDNVLDISTKTLIIDTNAIMAALPVAGGGVDETSTDDETMLIGLNELNITVTTPVPLTPTDYYYNAAFSNGNTLQRWEGYIPFTVYQLNQGLLQLVRAGQVGVTQLLQSSVSPIDTLICQDTTTPPNFDTGGNYAVGPIDFSLMGNPIPVQYQMGYFTAPVNDYYTFNVFFQLNTSNAGYSQTTLRVARWNGTHYEETEPPILLHSATQPPWGPPPNYSPSQGIFINFVGTIEGGGAFYMASGDIAFVLIEYTSFGELITYNGVFEAVQYGATYSTKNSADNMLDRYDFERPISEEAWCAMKSNPFNLFRLGYIDGGINTRMIDVTRNTSTQKTKFTMGSRRTQNK